MIKLVTYLSFFGGGCALGVLATKTYFQKKYMDLAEEEINSVKELYRKKSIALDEKEKKEEIKDDILNPEIEKQPIGGGLFMNMTPEHMKEMAVNYHTLSNDVSADSHPIEENYKPYFIDIDTFDETHNGFSKVEYSYYLDDSTLVDIEDEIINPSDTIGIDNLELFENMEDEVCYIRNESSGIDYEVTKVFSSYSSIVGDDY